MEEINEVQNLEVASDGKQYIVVSLGEEQYGIHRQYRAHVQNYQDSQRAELLQGSD